MKALRIVVRAMVFAWIGLAPSLVSAVGLAPVVSTGHASPLFVANAQDGSKRLFIVERGGAVRVLQPGASTTTLFLDIGSKLISGDERGLLGLAFHPSYARNGRFFVYYTRAGDGALVIAEYAKSSDPNVASAVETVLLVISHPTHANHNGGMLAFGPDGYLYVGVGDGGSANDPSNNAQNVDVLLGKILRIDVDRPNPVTGARYTSPADNPFASRPGRDEIFALGLRNPWRFSFDRVTGVQWVGDVGQNAREEVHAPIFKGGNYGWRVYEGMSCTGNDPLLCNPANYIGPLFEYEHALERCSITGGYVYRGSQATLPAGTYVYGDFCTGEIFAWNGATQTLLIDTATSLVSFGEDEDGELYLVDLAGTLGRIEPDATAATLGAVEFFHSAFGHYFVSASVDEIAKLDAGGFDGWARTGQTFRVHPLDTIGQASMCRFFTTSFTPKSSHFYTPLTFECGIVKENADWQFEGDVFSVRLPDSVGSCPTGSMPLYRLYNDGQGGAANHRYTTSLEIRSGMLAQRWIPEGQGGLGVIACVPT